MDNEKQGDGLGLVGLIIAFIFPLIGLILSIIGFNNNKKNNGNIGFAIAGIILSSITIFIRLIAVLLIFVFGIINVPGLVKNGFKEMCSKVEICEHMAGNIYNCSYKRENANINVTCEKKYIPDNVLIKDITDNKNKEDKEDNKPIKENTKYIEKYSKDEDTFNLYANGKNNTITFEYVTEPYISAEKLDEEQIKKQKENDDFIYNITSINVKINNNLVEGYHPIYEYNSKNNFKKTLNKNNIKVLKGNDKDYFVLLIEEDNYQFDGVTNPYITNEKGKEIKRIEFISGASMWVTDKNSILYNAGAYVINNDKVHYIGCAENSVNKNGILGKNDVLYQEYILTVNNDKAIITKGSILEGTGAGAKVC